jgi:hypothetical protein
MLSKLEKVRACSKAPESTLATPIASGKWRKFRRGAFSCGCGLKQNVFVPGHFVLYLHG